MKDLFSTNLLIDGQSKTYRVVFEQEQYRFIPAERASSSQAFSLQREHDEWQSTEVLTADIKKQAVEALEKYLLQQH